LLAPAARKSTANLDVPGKGRYTQRSYNSGRNQSKPALRSPEEAMAAKKFNVKLSTIAKDIDRAIRDLKKIRKKVSSQDCQRLDLNVQNLEQARTLVSTGCSSGSKKMTATFVGS
jgi:hypothetical protein